MISVYYIQLEGLKLDVEAIDSQIQKKFTDPAVLKAASEVTAECVPLSASEDR